MKKIQKTSTWVAVCKACKSPVYYYPAKLLLESISFKEPTEDTNERVVDCTCTGEIGNTKHTQTYIFPKDFTKLGTKI